MSERLSLTDELSYMVTENNEDATTNIAWFKCKGASYLDGTKTFFGYRANFDVEDQPHAGLREVIRRVIIGRLKL
jgi:hypothetical protein